MAHPAGKFPVQRDGGECVNSAKTYHIGCIRMFIVMTPFTRTIYQFQLVPIQNWAMHEGDLSNHKPQITILLPYLYF
jgi:hypothetical protein